MILILIWNHLKYDFTQHWQAQEIAKLSEPIAVRTLADTDSGWFDIIVDRVKSATHYRIHYYI